MRAALGENNRQGRLCALGRGGQIEEGVHGDPAGSSPTQPHWCLSTQSKKSHCFSHSIQIPEAVEVSAGKFASHLATRNMARWHRSSCSKPQVVVCGELPFCTNCENLAPDDIAEHPQPLSVGASPPRTGSQFNLNWPTAVKYVRSATPDTITSPQPNSELTALTSLEGGDGAADLISAPDAGSKNDRVTNSRSMLYSVLDNLKSIRLLSLEPGRPSDPIHGYFLPMDLEGSAIPEYDAISYTWADTSGDMQRRQPVFLGLHWDVLQVTNNCAAVLRRVRQTHARRLVWVDAVCINQDDHAERSAQVQLMRAIYARASSVLVYLGDDNFEDSHLALSALAQRDYAKIFSRGAHGQKPLAVAPRRYDTQPKNPERVDDIRTSAALNRLLARPYFQRLWVVQEFVSAQTVQVYCGTGAAPWPLSGLDVHQNIQAATSSIGREAPWVRYRDIKGKISPDHLWDILLDTCQCLCSDPRDKVFAVLGLINTWNGTPVMADYSRTTEEVYIGIAAYLGQVTGRFRDVLGLAAEQRGESASRRQLPSWVPDWSTAAGHLSRFHSRSSAYDRFACFLSLSSPSGQAVGIRSDTGSLRLQATRLCAVREHFAFENAGDSSWTYRGTWPEPGRCVKLVLPQIPVGELDELFWLRGIGTFAILRPSASPESQSYSLVAVGDLVFTPPNLHPPPKSTRVSITQSRFNVRSSRRRLKEAGITSAGNEKSLRTIRSFRPAEKRYIVDYFSAEPVPPGPLLPALGPTEEQFQGAYITLLDALRCIKAGLVRSEITLWTV